MSAQFEHQPSKPSRYNKKHSKRSKTTKSTQSKNISPSISDKKSILIKWDENKTYNSEEKINTIYPLSKPPTIPEGRWYSYIDKEKIINQCYKEKHDENEILRAITNVLGRGLFTSHGTGIMFSVSELHGTNYCCKIRLFGIQGKGDIRVYGRIENTTTDLTEGKNRTLICFDHIEFHANQKKNIPTLKLK